VIDILEQYPLPLHQTLEIAASLNVVHPGNYQERGNHGGRIPAKTMTQDYVVLRQSDSGKARLTAYSFKYSDALDPAITSPRVVNRTRAKEKIALEYWRTQNVDHVLVTEKDFDATFIYNLEFLRECYDSKNLLQVSADFYDNVIVQFKSHMMTAPLSTLRMLIQQVAHEINIDELQVACLFQHAVYTGRIDIDLTRRIELYHPLPALRGSRAD
ncbi:TnsA endonuclease N-terminal domain-containing protein, partial [Aeromonas veronii bv. sobria]|uniref:TnsA endonuclease N-terminal domain-containing protein n=2 Tax=Aeromonas veronii TaxID=654 RepID=UPI003CE5BDFF